VRDDQTAPFGHCGHKCVDQRKRAMMAANAAATKGFVRRAKPLVSTR
jgi:hypothetical protein